ncbi:hypothetical protein ACROYT_G016499 [Oculina patagonica]
MKSIAFAAVLLLIEIEGALAIRCYECVPEFSIIANHLDVMKRSGTNSICGNPNETIDCSGPLYDSCVTSKLTGRKTGIGEFTINSLNCTSKMMCSIGLANSTYAEMKALTDAVSAELVNWEIKCCQGDLCNKPAVPSMTPPSTTAKGSTTAKSAAGINFPQNQCAIFGILGVITLVFMNIF